ncbi:hypothetical protein LCGC14_1620660, partial [marine sediment metagenome]
GKEQIEKFLMMGPIGDYTWNRLLPMMKITAFNSYMELLRGLRDGARFQRTFAKVPGLSPQKARQIGEPLDSLLEGIPVLSDALKRFGGVKNISDWDIVRAAADAATNTGGGINWALVGDNPGLLQRIAFLTPGWFRANAGSLINGFKVGSPKGVLARRIFAQQMMMAGAVSTFASLAWSGRLPEYDPRESKFLNVETPTGSLAILPAKTYGRLAVRMIAGTPWEDDEAEGRALELSNFLEGRQGMWPSIATDLYTGEDFFGNKITNPYTYVAQQILPIGAGEATVAWQEGARGEELYTRISAGFGGMNFIPVRAGEQRDDLISRAAEWRDNGQPFVDSQGEILLLWNELTADQQREFKSFDKSSEGPHLQQKIDDDLANKESPFAELKAVDKASEQALADAGDQLISQGAVIGSRAQYRQRVSAIRTVERMAREILRQREGIEDQEPNTTDQRIVEGYFEEVVDASLDPEFRDRLLGQIEQGTIEETILSAALELDPEIFEANERAYFSFVESKYGKGGLDKLKTILNLSDSTDGVLASFGRDKDMLNEGYYEVRDGLFTPSIMEEVGLPKGIPDQFLSWEQFKNNTLIGMSEDLEGAILPPSIGEIENRSEETIYERFRILPTQTLNKAQAEGVARVLGDKIFKGYEDLRTKVSNEYLALHPDQLCALSYWEYRESVNDDLKPFLTTCSSRIPQPSNYP